MIGVIIIIGMTLSIIYLFYQIAITKADLKTFLVRLFGKVVMMVVVG